jgi:V-type H+-transporting ATPase subunit C
VRVSVVCAHSGNLLTRDLTGIILPEHITAIGSEFLVTMFVVVPKSAGAQWEASYEKFSEYVAPRSSRLVESDSEYGLWSVTLFRKAAPEFKEKCRENK